MRPTNATRPDGQHRLATYNAGVPPILCPSTGSPCEGDLSNLCGDYGCARKGGLSPRSEENL